MEKPIITRDIGFARSIFQDAALYFTPHYGRAAAQQMERLAHDPALYQGLCQRGRQRLVAFDTSAQRARKILDICKQLSAL